MARISTYIKDTDITRDDFVIGTDGDNQDRTAQFGVGTLTDFIRDGRTEIFSTRLLYGYSDDSGEVPDLFDENGNVTPKYAGEPGEDPPDDFPGTGAVPPSTPRPPQFEVVHGLNNSVVDVLVLRRTLHTPEPAIWTSQNTIDPANSMVNQITEQVERYSPYAPVGGIYIIDDNTIHVDFNNFELYDVYVIVSGRNFTIQE